MALKHNVRDMDKHFVVNAATRKIVKETDAKVHLMQYDHNSEVFTFEVPLEIENHDMSLCDVIQVHYENTSTGTSSSVRRTYRGVHEIKKEDINVEEDVITFSWLISDNATTFAGILKFQLKFICYDDADAGIEGYKWHSDVNEDISIKAGLGYSNTDYTPSTTATLQSIEIMETDDGVIVILDGVAHPIYHGDSGVYVGSGEMPEHCNVQIDPDGTDGSYLITQVIDENSTELECPSAKAVYDMFNSMIARTLTTDLEV